MFSSVTQSVYLFVTSWTTAHQASLHHQLPESTQIHVHRVGDPSNHLILCRPLLLLPLIFPSPRVFSDESTLCIRWSRYWSFSFSISPSSELPGLISFRMDWLDLLAVQGKVSVNVSEYDTEVWEIKNLIVKNTMKDVLVKKLRL